MEAVEAIIRGGAKVIQWRDKSRDKGEQLPIVREVNRLCAEAGVVSIVNDHVDLALVSGASGVHLGQKDLPLAEARKLMPGDAVIGVSTATVEEALLAEREGASYIAVGAIYPTSSKSVTRPAGTGDTGGGCKSGRCAGGGDWGHQRGECRGGDGGGCGLGVCDKCGIVGNGPGRSSEGVERGDRGLVGRAKWRVRGRGRWIIWARLSRR